MVSEKILVGSALGIHLRPAGAMCDTAVKFDSHITFTFKNKVVSCVPEQMGRLSGQWNCMCGNANKG